MRTDIFTVAVAIAAGPWFPARALAQGYPASVRQRVAATKQQIKTIDISKKLTLYCGSGTRCVLATKSLPDLGFSNVTAVDMRIDGWAKAGYPLVKK